MPTLASMTMSIPMLQKESTLELPYSGCSDNNDVLGPLQQPMLASRKVHETLTTKVLHSYRAPTLALWRIDESVTTQMTRERDKGVYTTIDLMLNFKEEARLNHHFCATAVVGQLDMVRYIVKHPDTPANHPFHKLLEDLLLLEVSPPLQQRTQITRSSTNTPYSFAHPACL